MPNPTGFLSRIVFALLLSVMVVGQSRGQMVTRTETFDADPGWDGRNNRSQTPEPRQVTQNFGYRSTSNAGGPAGEIGGLITPTGETAYYATVLSDHSYNTPLSASGTLKLDGGGNTLLGFFNADTFNEWRTADSLVLRLYGRGSYFQGYSEYATSKWRAGSANIGSGTFQIDTAPVYNWSLNYDPSANSGNGAITAAIGSHSSSINLPPGHRMDGATFNRFGLLNVSKSHDSPGQVWVDNLALNGASHSFSSNPNWDSLRNQTSFTTENVRFRFDFGYSPTHNAGGAGPGEMGGHLFRGDSRNSSTMAYYGDRLDQTLTLEDPLQASGKVSFNRGVTDSTVLIGFFHSTDSVRVSAEQGSSIPENFVGVSIEGPSAEGFLFYPTYGIDIEDQGTGSSNNAPYIFPNGDSHDWALGYDPNGGGGRGAITVTLDGQSTTMLLRSGDKARGAHFDRFGIVTTHVDGNGQTVYFDDLTYTVGFVIPEPTSAGVVLLSGLLSLLRRRRCPAN